MFCEMQVEGKIKATPWGRHKMWQMCVRTERQREEESKKKKDEEETFLFCFLFVLLLYTASSRKPWLKAGEKKMVVHSFRTRKG